MRQTLVCLAIVVSFFVTNAVAQTGFRATVQAIDPSNLGSEDLAPIPNATVQYIGPGMAGSATTVSGPDGMCEVVGLHPGRHVLTVAADKYRSRQDIVVTVVQGAVSPVDIKMASQRTFSNSILPVMPIWVAPFAVMLFMAALLKERSGQLPVAGLGIRLVVGCLGGPIVALAVGAAVGAGLALIVDFFGKGVNPGTISFGASVGTVSLLLIGPTVGLLVAIRPALTVRRAVLVGAVGGLVAGMTFWMKTSVPFAGEIAVLFDSGSESVSYRLFRHAFVHWVGSLAVGASVAYFVGAVNLRVAANRQAATSS